MNRRKAKMIFPVIFKDYPFTRIFQALECIPVLPKENGKRLRQSLENFPAGFRKACCKAMANQAPNLGYGKFAL